MAEKYYAIKNPSLFVIEKMEKIDNKSKFLNELVENYFKGKLIDSNKKEDYKIKLDRQKYLKLCKENWDSFKKSGFIYEEAKAIILGDKDLQEPTIENVVETISDSTNKSPDGVDRNCMCGHVHVDTIPHVCSNKDCLCGIRG